MSSIETATEEEVVRFTNAHVATQNALGDARNILKGLEAVTFDPTQKLKIVAKRRKIEDEIARNDQDFLAFFDGGMAMRMPTATQVEAIVKVAGELALLTQQKTTVEAAFKLANSVLDKAAKIRYGS